MPIKIEFKPYKKGGMSKEKKAKDMFDFGDEENMSKEEESDEDSLDSLFGDSESAVAEGLEEDAEEAMEVPIGEASVEQLKAALKQKEAEAKEDDEEFATAQQPVPLMGSN